MSIKTQTAMRADPHQVHAQENARDEVVDKAPDNVTNKKEDLLELQQIFAGLSAYPPINWFRRRKGGSLKQSLTAMESCKHRQSLA